MSFSFLPNNAFPLPAPLTPKLVALGLDNKTAETVSKVYISSALNLKRVYEAETNRACDAFVATSDARGYSSKELRSKLLSVTSTRYMQALAKWTEEAIEEAKTSLRVNKKIATQFKVRSPLRFALKITKFPQVKGTITPAPCRKSVFELASKKGNTTATVRSTSPCTWCLALTHDLLRNQPTLPLQAHRTPSLVPTLHRFDLGPSPS